MRTGIILILSGCLVLSSCGLSKKDALPADDSLKAEYLKKGSEVTRLAQAELLKNVSRAIQNGGPPFAIDFCNVHALLLKDSLSEIYDCEIRRIATRYRNPADKAQTESEETQLASYLAAHQNNENLAPEVHMFEDRVEYYQPIMISNGACLLCHGEPETHISEATMELIRTHYPEDLATGFELHDFRGAWKITFRKEKE